MLLATTELKTSFKSRDKRTPLFFQIFLFTYSSIEQHYLFDFLYVEKILTNVSINSAFFISVSVSLISSFVSIIFSTSVLNIF